MTKRNRLRTNEDSEEFCTDTMSAVKVTPSHRKYERGGASIRKAT